MQQPAVIGADDPTHLRCKSDFYALSRRGLTGNHLAQTPWAEFYRHPKPGNYGIRVTTPGSPFQKYHLTMEDVLEYVPSIIAQGCKPGSIFVCQSAPDHDITCQGEAMRTEEYLDVIYSEETVPMRTALAMPTLKRATGCAAMAILKHRMDGASWDELQGIWDRWPDSIVEFTCFRRALGEDRCNTLFWEVRHW